MAKAPQRTPIPGPAFIRLIARLTDAGLPESSPALADRLSEWIDWTRAVALSKALDGRLPEITSDTPQFGSVEEHECARVRAALVTAITADVSAPPAKHRKIQPPPAADDYIPLRERYRDLQQSMQAETGRLRGHLRDMLAAGSPERARLAEVDAVMEITLSPREQALLGAVPTLLGQHFERQSDKANEALIESQASSGDCAPATTAPWRRQFEQNMQHVLLAELDVRFQPVDGLLAALRT